MTNLSLLEKYGAYCVTEADGVALYGTLLHSLETRESVTVSFEGVETLTCAFLNASFGALVGDATREELKQLFYVSGLDGFNRALLMRVIDNAYRFFEKREKMENQ